MNQNQVKVKRGDKRIHLNVPWLIILVILILAFAVYFLRPSAAIDTTGSTVPETLKPTVSEADMQPDKLSGKWQRTDGGYVLELKTPTKEGLIEASYFNPNPIHVGRAAWQNQNGMLRVMVELQDKNYPGSLYTLMYHPGDDQLRGTYFQAMERVNYNVAFTRIL